jgi:sn-glycerol 3-phosphate transport system ATP-binding protein
MARVSLRDVRKSFGAVDVIRGITMEIADGEFVVMVGPSGCGKSTLLRMIAGLETVGSGEVAIDGHVVNEVEPKDRNIAMVFQNYALYPHMSVYDNLAYGLRMRKLSKADIEARVRRAAQALEIERYLERKPRELSGGQRQRVAMGRAIVREPAVFLFDEPLSNLDAKLRVQMRAQLLTMHRRLRTTTLYVTHDQVEAMTLADRMLVMNGGLAEQVGGPLEVYDRPASTFVAGFIGSPPMNLVPGRIAPDGAALEVAPNNRVLLPKAVSAIAGRDVLLGVRPEHLELAGGQPALLELVVDFVELLGSESLVFGYLGAGREGGQIAAHLHASMRGAKGHIPLTFAAENLHLFDPASGKRIELA